MFERPRGTRDFGPEEMAERRKLERILRRTFESYGYHEVMTPTFEHAELFVERSGPGILEEMYAFEDKGGRNIALRPELTAPVMRFYTQDMQRLPKPLKLYYFGPAFRYERPQKGRYREFWQMGLELIGADTPEATAEMMSVAYDSMKNAGLKNFRLRIGDVRILKHFLDSIGKNDRDVMRAIDKRDENALPSEILNFISLDDAGALDGYGPEDEVEHYRTVLDILDAAGVEYVMDLGIARGLDYYTGVVFEIEAPELGAEKQICGGGEYRLAELFGAQPVATSGFAIGFDRTLLALKKEGFAAGVKAPDAYIIPFNHKIDLKAAFSLARKLRDNGLIVEMEINGKKMGKALKRADALRSKYVIIVKTDIVEEETSLTDMAYLNNATKEKIIERYTIRNMKTGKQEEYMDFENIVSLLGPAHHECD